MPRTDFTSLLQTFILRSQPRPRHWRPMLGLALGLGLICVQTAAAAADQRAADQSDADAQATPSPQSARHSPPDHASNDPKETPVMRPHLLVTAKKVPGLRSLEELREAVKHGPAKALWDGMRKLAEKQVDDPAWLPTSDLAWRDKEDIERGEPDINLVRSTGRRILRDALACMITQDMRYRDAAMRQVAALMDKDRWPTWIQSKHLKNKDSPVYIALRAGDLSRDLALAYDWLAPYMSDDQQQMFLDGLKERAIQPFWKAIGSGIWWANARHNWMTNIVGALGMVGMAIKGDDPSAKDLIGYSLHRMRDYMQMYGPKGEFNEAPMYAGATLFPATYFSLYHYQNPSEHDPLADKAFVGTSYWMLYLTLPPGRMAPFGDSNLYATSQLSASWIAAVAAATQDPVLQWRYLRYAHWPTGLNEGVLQGADRPDNINPRELLWFDPTLKPQSPAEANLPLGAAFPAYGDILVSRSNWATDIDKLATIVYAKADMEDNHHHYDAGQTCIDGYGQRLIVDLGKPKPGYPPKFFKMRQHYYISNATGHNVLTFGDRGMKRIVHHGRNQRDMGRIVAARFGHESAGDPHEQDDGKVGQSGFELEDAASHDSGKSVKTREPGKADQSTKTGEVDETDGIGDQVGGAVWTLDTTAAYEGVKSVRRMVVHLPPAIVAVVDEAKLEKNEKVTLRWHTAKSATLGDDGRFSFTEKGVGLSALVRSIGPANHGDLEMSLQKHAYHAPYDKASLDRPLKQRHEPFVRVDLPPTDHARILSLFAVAGPDQSVSRWKSSGANTWQVTVAEDTYQVSVKDQTLTVEPQAAGPRYQVELGTHEDH